MQSGQVLQQLEAARGAIVQLHTQLSRNQKQQEAVAAQHHKAFMQLERKHKLLDEQHDSMSATVKSFDERNCEAIAEIRTYVNTFLTELISVVGRQFENIQADLKDSHAETIGAEVQQALENTYSAAAGKKMERWVHSRVTDLTQRLEQVCTKGAHVTQELPAKAQHVSAKGDEDKEHHGSVGIEQKTLANTGDADMHQHQKQAACQTSRQVDNANQATQTHVSTTAIQQHTLSPSPDGKQSIARSRNSLSLMHHASAAGSRTTTVARSPVPAQSMHTSSAAVRQPLTKLDINQQQQHYRQTQSADSPRDGGQAEAGCPVSMSTELHKCHHDNHAAHYNQQWQQQQQQNKLQVELPAGIPLTPVLSQKAQPRDSLEASIWKLSCSQEKQQMPPKNAFGPQEQNKPQKGAGGMYGLQPNRQQPISHDKSLHMVRDSLEATLHKLAASQ